jgi:hypothetical protein
MSEYQWKTTVFAKVKAQDAGEFIEDHIARHGKADPTLMVEESRPDDATLHPLYEWDDSVAAQRFREGQSTDILRSIVVIKPPTQTGHEPVQVRAFVNVPTQDGGETRRSYVPIDTAMSNPDMRKCLLAEAYRDLQRFQHRYALLREVQEMAPVFREIDSLLHDPVSA